MVKNPSACNAEDVGMGVLSLSQEDPWSRKWQPTPVFLPGRSHGQRSPVGYSPWAHRVVQDCVTEHARTQCRQARETGDRYC